MRDNERQSKDLLETKLTAQQQSKDVSFVFEVSRAIIVVPFS